MSAYIWPAISAAAQRPVIEFVNLRERVPWWNIFPVCLVEVRTLVCVWTLLQRGAECNLYGDVRLIMKITLLIENQRRETSRKMFAGVCVCVRYCKLRRVRARLNKCSNARLWWRIIFRSVNWALRIDDGIDWASNRANGKIWNAGRLISFQRGISTIDPTVFI